MDFFRDFFLVEKSPKNQQNRTKSPKNRPKIRKIVQNHLSDMVCNIMAECGVVGMFLSLPRFE